MFIPGKERKASAEGSGFRVGGGATIVATIERAIPLAENPNRIAPTKPVATAKGASSHGR